MIVALDGALYEEYGSFPFRRTDLGKIAHIFSGFGARVVGFDFLMGFKSSYGEDEPTSAIIDNLARLRIHLDITMVKEGWPFSIQALNTY